MKIGPDARPVPGPLVDWTSTALDRSSPVTGWRGGGGRWSPIRDRNQPADQLLMAAPRAALATARQMVLVSTGMSLWVAPLFSLLWRPSARCRQSRSGPVPTEPGSGGDLVTAQGRTPDIDASGDVCAVRPARRVAREAMLSVQITMGSSHSRGLLCRSSSPDARASITAR